MIAYLQVNVELGIQVRHELVKDYEMNGRSESTQMKKALVERCSPDICKQLKIAHDNSENVTEIIFSILRNEALRNNDTAVIMRLVK